MCVLLRVTSVPQFEGTLKTIYKNGDVKISQYRMRWEKHKALLAFNRVNNPRQLEHILHARRNKNLPTSTLHFFT